MRQSLATLNEITVIEPASRSTRKLIVRRRDLGIGTVINGRYRIVDVLGMGGMGAVYEAADVDTDARVAVKALNVERYLPANLRRLRREAALASKVNHPNVCRVHYYGVANGVPLIVMDRLYGETLRARLQSSPLGFGDAISVMIQLLDALEAIHNANILHRDVKPSNIFLVGARSHPVVKLVDFGVSRSILRADEDTAITETGEVPGTPTYLSPEQVLGQRDLDGRVDLWAAGLVLFELLTGQRAYKVRSFEELYYAIAYGQMASPSQVHPNLPPGLEEVVMRALTRQRAHRFPTARKFKEALVTAWATYRVAGLDLKKQRER